MSWAEDEAWIALAQELSFHGCSRDSLDVSRWSLDALRRSIEVTPGPPKTCADWLHGIRDGREIFVVPAGALDDHTLVVVPIEPPLGLDLEIRRKGVTDRAAEVVDDALHRFVKATVWWGLEGFVVSGPSTDRVAQLFSDRAGLALRGRIENAVQFLRISDDAVFSGSPGLVTRANDVRYHMKIGIDLAERIVARRLVLAPTEDEARLREEWARFATTLDLTLDPARLRAFGNVGSVHIDLRAAGTRNVQWTSVDVTVDSGRSARKGSTDFTIAQLPSKARNRPVADDIVALGHFAFDAQFVVRAIDEAAVRARLRTPLLDKLVEHARTATNTIAKPGRLSFEIPSHAETAEALAEFAERALSLASAVFDGARMGPYR